MRRARLAMLLVATMLFAGCLGANTAEWGSSGIEVEIDRNPATEASITTNLGDSKLSFDNLSPIGCNVGEEIYLSKNASDRIKFSGFLSASMLYDSHDPINGAAGMDNAVTAAVAIQAMPKADAGNVKDGEGARIDIKQWNVPLMPETRAGTVDLDEIDQDTESDWYILGLIPTTENLNDGFKALSEWHKPITIHGYLISPTLVNGSSFASGQSAGYYKAGNASYSHTVNDDCELNVGINNLQSVYVLVDKIEINGEVISASGNSDDEWKNGDMPILGRAGFILFFLVVGIGGAFGMFILSQMIVRQGAKETMKILLGDEGLAKIKKVAADLRRDKKSGNISPTERKRQQDKQDREEKKQRKPPSKSKDNAGPLAGFDLDSALSSDSDDDAPREFGGKSSSVVVSQEAVKLEQQAMNNEPAVQQESWSPPTSTRTSSPVSNVVSSEPERKRTEHFTGSARKQTSTPKAAAPVKKRRAAKKRKAVKPAQEHVEPEPQYEEKPHREAFEEDDDFSDFSL